MGGEGDDCMTGEKFGERELSENETPRLTEGLSVTVRR